MRVLYEVGLALRILGGDFKGRQINVFKGEIFGFRPTSVLIRRSLFDSIQNWEGTHFFDCYGGSGIMGLEALSRGAIRVSYVENNRRLFQFFKREKDRFFSNSIGTSSMDDRSIEEFRLVNSDVKSVIRNLSSYSQVGNSTDLVSKKFLYFDPPFENTTEYRELIELLNQLVLTDANDSQMSNTEVQIALEADSSKTMPEKDLISLFSKHFLHQKTFRHGSRFLLLFRTIDLS